VFSLYIYLYAHLVVLKPFYKFVFIVINYEWVACMVIIQMMLL